MSRDAAYLNSRGWTRIANRKIGCVRISRWNKGNLTCSQHQALLIERHTALRYEVAQKAKALMESDQ